MKFLTGFLVILLLLVGFYALAPGLTEKVVAHWKDELIDIAKEDDKPPLVRRDSLLQLSLTLRAEGRHELSMQAAYLADSILGGTALTHGLLGLYYVESGNQSAAIEMWKKGADRFPNNANLAFLANLDSEEVQYLDIHMLEKMFVDSLVNQRLESPLYQVGDADLSRSTQEKLRIKQAIDRTLVAAFLLMLILIGISFIGALRQKSICGDIRRRGWHMLIVSLLIKTGWILIATFNLFFLGSNISELVSRYVLTPDSIMELLEDNLQFFIILGIVTILEVLRHVDSTRRIHINV